MCRLNVDYFIGTSYSFTLGFLFHLRYSMGYQDQRITLKQSSAPIAPTAADSDAGAEADVGV